MEDLSGDIIKLSKINSAFLINIRISKIWENVNKASLSGKYSQWNLYLDRIWCELIGDIGKTKKDDKGNLIIPKEKKDFNGLNESVSKALGNLEIKQGFSQYTKEDKTKMFKTYESLMKKEEFLRTLMNKQGKGTAYQEEADWD